ncbi:MAG: type II CAAX endopeptidase family protein [Streptococcus sp.]|nr:type II CAAX endopeptidase family protein [Streptococcus sp.]
MKNTIKSNLLNALSFLGLIVLILIANVTPSFLITFQHSISPVMKWVYLLLYLAYIFTFITLLWKDYKKNQPSSKKSFDFHWKDFGISLLFYLGVRVTVVLLTSVNSIFNHQTTSANDAAIFDTAGKTGQSFLPYSIIFFLMIGLFAPIIEELVFRFFGSTVLFHKNQKILAGIVTSLIFSLLHSANIFDLLLYFGVGGILYISYRRRDNVVDSIIVHILNNGIIALVLLFLTLFGTK